MPAPLPEAVADELTRLVRRWQALPLDQALSFSAPVRALAQQYAAARHPGIPLPDLGPAVLPDQLTVVLYDALAAGDVTPAAAHADLVGLRRTLSARPNAGSRPVE
ncbi:hypothetical protein [Nostocoides australiense]|uniref:DUF4129 domain-containing protein n=1 Tax=Nostocoides australiense Ben110 TaxID=1193182 RepID=W6JVL6_9MICO|nr:hypothetical protein [Tetrasphaera australiensis]MCA0292110.1 hypothetical protein [Actinomycetota bacterium]MCB1252154.1 hypothetical protein [Austwickia sp.]HRW03191.1 hypothetical protein [Tetrasphaera sp.]CCH73508.1 conserved hypothetical protein [Tetrasphaera australiensis Ben110]HPF80838.1 hypothetical protein [Tetrasphaera australiensis]